MTNYAQLISRVLALVAATLIASTPLGCNSSGGASGGSDYVRAYEAGRYNEAFDLASKAANRGRGISRDQAALIAGLSAQALGRADDATKYLTPLVSNPDQKTSGEAAAALGLIAAEKGKHADAAEMLAMAGRKLTGDHAARSFMYAGDSYKTLGQSEEARGMWSMAQTKVTDDRGLRVMIGDRLNSTVVAPPPAPVKVAPNQPGATRFCVQVGAFSSFTNAQKQLGRFRAYGTPRVEEVSRGGKTLFVVRVGNYADRAEADRVAKNIGKEARVMPLTASTQ
jgi:cell division septation protein DedD